MTGLLMLALMTPRTHAEMTQAEFLKTYGRPLAEDRVYYRWQSTASGENLVRAGTLTERLNEYFMGITEQAYSGPGLYMANTEVSSANYLPPTGGNLIEVHIAKGTPELDLTDPQVMNALRTHNFVTEQFENWRPGGDGVLLKYTSHYAVGKDITNRATFQMYPGPQHSIESIVKTLEPEIMKTANVDQQLINQIVKYRPDAMAAITESVGQRPEMVRLLPDGEVPKVVRSALAQDYFKNGAMRLLDGLSADPRAIKYVLSDPELRTRASAVFDRLYGDGHGIESFKVLRDLAAADPRAGFRRERLMKLVNTALHDRQLERRWPELAMRLLPILEAVKLTEAERDEIAGRLRQLIALAPAFDIKTANLRQILDAAHVADPGISDALASIEARSRAVALARETGRAADLRAAFAKQSNFYDLHSTFMHLRDSIDDHHLDAAIGEVFRADPKKFASLVTSSTDLDLARDLIQRSPSIGFERIYHAMLDQPPAARERFFAECLENDACGKNLAAWIKSDRGRLLRGLPDPHEAWVSLSTLRTRGGRHLERARAVAQAIFATIDEPHTLASFGDAVVRGKLSETYAPLVIARAEELGLDRFRSHSLTKLAEIAPKKADARRLMLRALDAAANPSELTDVAILAQRLNLTSDALVTHVGTTFRRMNAEPEDYALAERSGVPIASPRKPAALDCVNGLARLIYAY